MRPGAQVVVKPPVPVLAICTREVLESQTQRGHVHGRTQQLFWSIKEESLSGLQVTAGGEGSSPLPSRVGE